MKACGCDFCNNLINIEPAKYISGGSDEIQNFLKKAKEDKKFILWEKEGNDCYLTIVDKCPVCGYEFSEEDYDSYE